MLNVNGANPMTGFPSKLLDIQAFLASTTANIAVLTETHYIAAFKDSGAHSCSQYNWKRKGVSVIPLNPQCHIQHIASYKGCVVIAEVSFLHLSPFTMAAIYAPSNNNKTWQKFFHYLASYLPLETSVIVGDFNMVQRWGDCLPCKLMPFSSVTLDNILSVLQLRDPAPPSSAHMFLACSDGHTACLDCFYILADW